MYNDSTSGTSQAVNSKKHSLRHLDILIPVTAIVITIVLLSGPIVVYYTRSLINNENVETTNQEININITREDCFSWSESKTFSRPQCTNLHYEGTVCEHVLNSWQRCIGDHDKTLYVSYINNSIDEREKQIINLNTILTHNKECQKVALPFLCQYKFPLHDCTRGIIYTATREDCIDISTRSCAQLWSLAIGLGYSDRLPSCQDLPTRTVIMNNSQSMQEETHNISNNTITCRDDFILINRSTCIPSCHKFEEYTHAESLLLIHSEWIFSLAALLESFFILILLLKNYKELFVSPSLLLFFEVIDCFIIAFLIFVLSANRHNFMCTSDDSLLHSLNNPTPFCTLSGVMFHFALLNMDIQWSFHVIIFFYKMVFPYHAHRMAKTGREKYIYITMTLISVVFPLPAIIICLTLDEYKYHLVRFPATVCISSGKMFFYAMTLIVDVSVCIGMILLIIVFWIIHKRNSTSLKTRLSTAEKKIIIIFVSIILFALTILAYASHVSATAETYETALRQYFQCEAFGYEQGKCDRNYEGITSPYWSMIVYGMIGLIPLSIINYVLKWDWIKKCCKEFFCKTRKCHKSTSFKEDQNIPCNNCRNEIGCNYCATTGKSAVSLPLCHIAVVTPTNTH